MDELSHFSMARPLVIIGAGIGGLTLGKCLQRYKIPFTIYERADALPRHKYGISLAQRTFQPLLEVLQTSELEFRSGLAVAKAPKRCIPVADGTSEKRGNTPVSVTSQRSTSDFRVNRSAFEILLSKSIQSHIQYSTKIKTVVSGPHLEITLDDGNMYQSDLVIDCSGIHSPIRAALLPHVQPVIHPFVAINGKRYLRREEWEKFYRPEFGDTLVQQTNVSFKHEEEGIARNIVARLEIAINETVLDDAEQLERISISYTYSRQAFSDNDTLYLPNRSKEAATNIPAQFFGELASLVKSGKLSPAYINAFDPSDAVHDRLLNWLLRSVYMEDPDIKALRDQGVLMIGDASYAEPIVGSVPGGANHVIKQAMRLAGRIVAEWKRDKKISEMDLGDYLEPRPNSREEDIALHLENIHQLKPAKAVL